MASSFPSSPPDTWSPPAGGPGRSSVLPAPRWNLADAAIGWVGAQVAAVVGFSVMLAASGRTGDGLEDLSLSFTVLAQLPLWLGFIGAAVFAARYRGNGLVRDFGFRVRLIDLPVGLAVGLVSQLVLVPLVSWPWLALFDKDPEDLSRSAQALTDKATDPFGVVLLILIVGVGAPLAEELFFRGLLFRSLERWAGPGLAIAGSALVFGATHFQLLALPGLAAFGAVLAFMVWRTGRLGPALVAHLGFNCAAVVFILQG